MIDLRALSIFDPGRAGQSNASAPWSIARRGREHRSNPASMMPRLIPRGLSPGPAAAPRLDSSRARPSQAWAWPFGFKESNHHSGSTAGRVSG